MPGTTAPLDDVRSLGRMSVLETDRLRLRLVDGDDAAFILELLNDPGWIRYIGDRKVRTLGDAARYIENGPAAMYRRHGFGLYLVELRQTGHPIGLCGLIKRDTLADVDIGFAFLPQFQGNGYALESAKAVLAYGAETLALPRVVAIVSPGNERSERLLSKLGFRHESNVRLQADSDELALYASAAGN